MASEANKAALRALLAALCMTPVACLGTIRQPIVERSGGVRGLSDQVLLAPAVPADRASLLARQRAESRAAWDRDPNDLDALIWYGRRLAYEARYLEAIDVFSVGLALHPGDSRLLRHRGHRYLSVRRLDLAVADLTAAAARARSEPDALELDGAPNPAGIPRSTRHSNIRYHLALAHYLRGEFELALAAHDLELEIAADNDDQRVSHGWWTWLALRRAAQERGGLSPAERAREAALLATIQPSMDLLENHAYHELLLLAKGERGPDELLDGDDGGDGDDGVQDATRAYGVAAWHLAHGRREQGLELCRQIVTSPAWMAFGVLAAEAELARAD